MRKPAVVVAVAVSVVLAGGILVVTTTAGAEETAAGPVAPSMVLPDRPAISQLPGAAGVPPASGLPAVPVDPASVTGEAAPSTYAGVPKVVDPAKPVAGRAAATRPAPVSPTEAKPGATVDDREGRKPARGTMPAARRDVTRSQALSTDPKGSVQRRALALINDKRRRGGCERLTVDRRLIAAANRHAAEMARRGYFAHEDSRGERAGDRVQDAGYRWSRYGENIAKGQDSVAEVVDGWMKSPEHRENILDCRLREVGVGLAFSADRTPYWVQDFATPQ